MIMSIRWIRPLLTIAIPGGIAVYVIYHLKTGQPCGFCNKLSGAFSHAPSTPQSDASAGAGSPAASPNLTPTGLGAAATSAPPSAQTYAYLAANGMPIPGQQQVAFNPDQLAGSHSTLDFPIY